MEEAIEMMKELRDISRDVLFLQIDLAKYHLSIDHLNFIMKKLKNFDWPPYSPDLNSIENIWAIIREKLLEKLLQL